MCKLEAHSPPTPTWTLTYTITDKCSMHCKYCTTELTQITKPLSRHCCSAPVTAPCSIALDWHIWLHPHTSLKPIYNYTHECFNTEANVHTLYIYTRNSKKLNVVMLNTCTFHISVNHWRQWYFISGQVSQTTYLLHINNINKSQADIPVNDTGCLTHNQPQLCVSMTIVYHDEQTGTRLRGECCATPTCYPNTASRARAFL